MSEHWLSKIVDLFSCETDDLLELARVAGYDAREFYRGTLSEREIEMLYEVPMPQEPAPGLIQVEGDLGVASAWLPYFRTRLSAPVKVFNNEIALAEAVLTGGLDDDVAAVLQRRHFVDEGLPVLTAALELLQTRSTVLLIIEGPFEVLAGQVPILSNFRDQWEGNGPTGRLVDGDLVTIDTGNRTVQISPVPLQTDIVATDQLTTAIRSARRVGSRQKQLHDTLEFVVELIEHVAHLATQHRRRQEVLPYLQLLLLLSKNVHRALSEFAEDVETDDYLADGELAGMLLDRLQEATLVSLNRGLPAIALKICAVQLSVISKMPHVFAATRDRQLAAINELLGDIQFRARRYDEATGHYATALDHIRYIDSSLNDRRELNLLASISFKLARTSGRLHRDDEEAHYAEQATDYVRRADYRFADREFRKLKSAVLFYKANVDFHLNRIDDAIRACDESITADFSMLGSKVTQDVLLSLMNTFRLKSELLWILGETHDGILARIIAVHFAYFIFMKARTVRSMKSGLRNMAEDTQAIKGYVRSKASVVLRTEDDELLSEALNLLEGVEVSADETVDQRWIDRVAALQRYAVEFFPAEIRQTETISVLEMGFFGIGRT